MAKVTIGGTDYIVPELNFIALELAWPYLEEATTTLDPMKGPSACISVIAAGLIEAEDFDPSRFGIGEDEKLEPRETIERVSVFLKRKLKANEIDRVKTCLDDIMEEAGLVPAEGEAPAPGEETQHPSPETAAASSQSSLPLDAKEEVGTA